MATNYVSFDVVVSAVASVRAARVAAMKQIADGANITPDKQGRFHAPHDVSSGLTEWCIKPANISRTMTAQ